jgi:TatD DNase family protein
MLTDAHCHPYDLFRSFPDAIQPQILIAASSCNLIEFTYIENFSRNNQKSMTVFPCFGVHPQIFALNKNENDLELLDMLASAGRISAIGECGFDLFNKSFRETEAIQDKVFTVHLETAIKYDLPLVLHIRRAIHKVFAVSKLLGKCKAVVFHSWSGTFKEAEAILQRGVNAYFSFGNTITLNHKQAIKSCALLPAQRLLIETDAPFQPRREKNYSSWDDLPLILEVAAALRCEAGNNISAEELETRIEKNFRDIFNFTANDANLC